MSETTVDPLAGPKAGANVHIPRDGKGRYLIPAFTGEFGPNQEIPESWTRASTIAKTIADQYGLSQWQLRMTAKGMSIRPDLVALAAATRLDDPQFKATMSSVVEQAKDAAAARASSNLGTAIHAFTEQIDRGEVPDHIPAPLDQDVAAYVAGLKKLGIEGTGLIERRIVRPDLNENGTAGVAGTFDRILRWEGRSVIADLKTGRDLKYGWNEIAIQLALYAGAAAMWDGEQFLPMPADLDQDTALVLHLPAGGVTQDDGSTVHKLDVYAVDLVPAKEAIELCMSARRWRRERKLAKLLTTATSGLKEDERTSSGLLTSSDAADEARQSTSDADVDFDLAPLAGKGQKGCSVCHRVGHRKGSPKCLGLNDPALTTEQVQAQECNHTNGWTRDAMGDWVCPDCGQESPTAQQAKEAKKAAEGINPEREQAVDDPFAETPAEPEQAIEVDPFADTPVEVKEPTWEDKVNACSSKGELSALRKEAMEAGAWTPELLKLGLARMAEVSEPGS